MSYCIQKQKNLELINIKKLKKKDKKFTFLPNNNLTRLFKELKIYIYKRMSTNNI